MKHAILSVLASLALVFSLSATSAMAGNGHHHGYDYYYGDYKWRKAHQNSGG